jgi:hypothetical protein
MHTNEMMRSHTIGDSGRILADGYPVGAGGMNRNDIPR